MQQSPERSRVVKNPQDDAGEILAECDVIILYRTNTLRRRFHFKDKEQNCPQLL